MAPLQMQFYVEDLARRWLSVAIAASSEKDRPVLYRTVAIEVFEGRGVRLVATDSYVLLSTWVPLPESRTGDVPTLDEAPDLTAVAIDPDGRGLGLLRYALQLDGRDEEAPPLDINLGLGIVVDGDTGGAFEGMAAHWVTLEVPSMERVQIPTYEGTFPSWRGIDASFKAKRTTGVALSTEILGRFGPLSKLWPGAALLWHFGGEDQLARLELDVDPRIDGMVMPIRHEAFGVDEDDDTSEELGEGDLARLAAEISMATGFGSAASIQRKAHVSYATAARALDLLEELGIVGDAIGSKARPLLVDEDRAAELLDGRYPRPEGDGA